MNKWVKHGMVSLIAGTSVFAVVAHATTETITTTELTNHVNVDANDLDGGSKLKDRMILSTTFENIKSVRALNN